MEAKTRKKWIIWSSIIGIIILLTLIIGLSVGLTTKSSKKVKFELYLDSSIKPATDDGIGSIDTSIEDPYFTYTYVSNNINSTILEDINQIDSQVSRFQIINSSGQVLAEYDANNNGSFDDASIDERYVVVSSTSSIKETLGLIDYNVTNISSNSNVVPWDSSLVTKDGETYSIVLRQGWFVA